jgi:hypothetical protein
LYCSSCQTQPRIVPRQQSTLLTTRLPPSTEDTLQRCRPTIQCNDSDVNGDEEDEKKEDSRTELDSHANMPVVRTADVKVYTPDYDSMQIRIVHAAVKYGCLRDVHDNPKIQVFDPNDKDHSIYFPGTKLRIPLSLCGVFSYFPTSNPTALEMMESEEVYMLSPSR